MKIVLVGLLLIVLLQDSDATYCLKYTTGYLFGTSYTYSTYVYCQYIAAVEQHTLEHAVGFWSIGAIVGAAVGGFIGLCVLICLIVICAKAANKSGSRGNVVRPVNYSSQNANVFVTSASAPPPYPGPGIPQPPPYAGPSGYNHPPSYTGAAGYHLPPNYAGPGMQHPPPNAIPGQPSEQEKF